jgi:hypothetical protein
MCQPPSEGPEETGTREDQARGSSLILCPDISLVYALILPLQEASQPKLS